MIGSMSPTILFLKASAIPPGARWITIHPGGDKDAKGQPVLIQPQPDGSAHVIGGAGGALNFLKLRAVQSKADYAKEAADRRKAKTAERKEQRARDKAAGIANAKRQAHEAVQAQRKEVEREFVSTVADAMGWDPDAIRFPEEKYEGVSDAARAKAEGKFHREVLAKANEAVALQRQRLVSDAAARMEAGISEIPLSDDSPSVISVADLDDVRPEGASLGFAPAYRERAEANGLDDSEVQEAKAERRAEMTDAQRAAAVARGETARMVKDELARIQAPILPDIRADLAGAKTAVKMIAAQKKLRQIQRKAQEANKEIAASPSEPKAYVLEYTATPDDEEKEIASDIEGDLRTIKTRAFLAEFQRLAGDSPGETLGVHIAGGAFNSVNSLALATTGTALVDRSVVDVLGVAGAAEVLARRLQRDLPDRMSAIADGMEDFHLNHYMAATDAAMQEARELTDAAKEIEIGDASTGADLAQAQELNHRRRRAVADAQRIVGRTLGEMEANAALVVALKSPPRGDFKVSLGKVAPESAIVQLRAIGLQRGDYSLSRVGADTFLTVTDAGMGRISKPVNRADLDQINRNMAIIGGAHDEDGWLPKGVADRPDLDMHPPAGVAPQLARPFAPGSDLGQSLRDYIGGRAADGDAPGDIVADIQSADFFRTVGEGRAEEYRKALDAVAPLKGQDGKPQRAEALADTFDKYADAYVDAIGGSRAPINRQQFKVDDKAVDALHRALAETPEGTAAYKQIGDLDSQDQRALREFWYRNVGKESPEQAALRAEAETLKDNEPPKEVADMFGESAPNPAWADWKAQRDEAVEKANAAGIDWGKYVETMRGTPKAYEAVQDLIRSRVSGGFARAYNTLNPGAPLKTGKTVIRNNLSHLDATDPEAREERRRKERELVDALRERDAGRYASGSVTHKIEAARERSEAMEQSQMGFFSSDEMGADANAAAVPLGADERHTIGHAAERQIAGMMGVVGHNFKPGQPVKLWRPSMSGPKNAARQRLVKMIEANKRVVAAFGTGSGKTLLSMAAFTHLKENGSAKRGLFLVPSIVQGQFSGEALRYLQPGKFDWHIEPGASREQRIAAYKNPKHDFCVMTHQSFRDDMVHLGAQHAGISEDEMVQRLRGMPEKDRARWMKSVMEREGISFDYLNVDESHNTVNRAGKENSTLANIVDALSANTPYYVASSADPVKNDVSEIFDVLHKMDPQRYADRGEFMRRYGPDTAGSKDALRREMARYVYPSKIDPEVHADRAERLLPLSKEQRDAVAALDGHFANARIARMEGRVDIDAMRAISPASFDGIPDGDAEAVARGLQENLGILKGSAIQRVLSTSADNPNLDEVAKAAKERSGRPGVVFAHSLQAVRMIADRLTKEGHRVVSLTGADSAKEKEAKRLAFNPEGGAPSADILVASDAGATGMNIQRGQWLYQFDTPMTAATHAQRQGRIFRTGQTNDVELIDAVPDHPSVHRARERLRTKYGLRELMTTPMDGLDDSGVAYYLRQREVAAGHGGDDLF